MNQKKWKKWELKEENFSWKVISEKFIDNLKKILDK